VARDEIIRRIELLVDAGTACLNAGKAHMALIWFRHARVLGDMLL
jgi:hypothetical protein